MLCWPDLPGRKDFDTGFAANERGDHAAVLREWYPLAEQEIADAQHTLSVIYKIGLDVPRVYVEAYQWADLTGERRGNDLSAQGTKLEVKLNLQDGDRCPKGNAGR